MIRFGGVLVFCLICRVALADIPPGPSPRPPSKQPVQPAVPDKPTPKSDDVKPEAKPADDGTAGLRVVLDKNAKMAKVMIPQKLAPEKGAAGKTGAIDPNTRTIIAGLALSLAAASLVLLPRWKRNARITATATASCLAFAVWVGSATGNAGPPPGISTIMGSTGHKIQVEYSKGSDDVVLVLPEKYLEELSKEFKK